MILLIITTVLLGLFNCWIYSRIEKKEGYCFHSTKDGQLVSMFSLETPSICKFFILLQFIPFVNIVFALLYFVDILNGHL
ncbi:hypothetical protein DIDNDMLP_00429 [Klebsiella phage KP13-7]|nr:hypothetical protein DIDNDMLP_00429 [Klebsiella phage KP13-7]